MNTLFIGSQEIILIGTQEILILFIVSTLGYSIYRAAKNPNLNGPQKLFWILIILFTSILGCIAYWIFDRTANRQEAR